MLNTYNDAKRRLNHGKGWNCNGKRLRYAGYGKSADVLEKLGIDYEMTIISAHREPDVFFEYAKDSREQRL